MAKPHLYSTAVLGLILLTGCSSQVDRQNTDQGAYCLNGSRENNYSCDSPTASTAQPVASHQQENEIDEAWMYTKLAELRAWLEAEHRTLDEKPATDPVQSWQTLQLGSFKNSDNAARLQQSLLNKGYETFTRHKGELTIIYVGREHDSSQLSVVQATLLEELGLLGMIVDFPKE